MKIVSILRPILILTVSLALALGAWVVKPQTVYAAGCDGANIIFSELDYDQPSTDDYEFIELRIINAVTISDCELRLLSGATPSSPVLYRTIDLSGSWTANTYLLIGGDNVFDRDVTMSCTTDCIQNGPNDGVALVDTSGAGSLVWFMSYEGPITNYNPGDGTSNSSTNLSVSEDNEDDPNVSIINGPVPGVGDTTLTTIPTPGWENIASNESPNAVSLSGINAISPLTGFVATGLLAGGLIALRKKK